MAQLRRTKSGPFNEDNIWTLQDLTDAYQYHLQGNDKFLRKMMLPINFAVDHLAKVWVLDTSVDTICHGASLGVPGVSKLHTEIQAEDYIAIMSLKDELVGYGKAMMSSKEMLNNKKGIAVRLDKVFMEPGTYPRIQNFPDTKKD
jgi:H/ACA ribonucleoprotein complex subunit 4